MNETRVKLSKRTVENEWSLNKNEGLSSESIRSFEEFDFLKVPRNIFENDRSFLTSKPKYTAIIENDPSLDRN